MRCKVHQGQKKYGEEYHRRLQILPQDQTKHLSKFGGRLCKDGSLDMRCKVHQGQNKYGEAYHRCLVFLHEIKYLKDNCTPNHRSCMQAFKMCRTELEGCNKTNEIRALLDLLKEPKAAKDTQRNYHLDRLALKAVQEAFAQVVRKGSTHLNVDSPGKTQKEETPRTPVAVSSQDAAALSNGIIASQAKPVSQTPRRRHWVRQIARFSRWLLAGGALLVVSLTTEFLHSSDLERTPLLLTSSTANLQQIRPEVLQLPEPAPSWMIFQPVLPTIQPITSKSHRMSHEFSLLKGEWDSTTATPRHSEYTPSEFFGLMSIAVTLIIAFTLAICTVRDAAAADGDDGDHGDDDDNDEETETRVDFTDITNDAANDTTPTNTAKTALATLAAAKKQMEECQEVLASSLSAEELESKSSEFQTSSSEQEDVSSIGESDMEFIGESDVEIGSDIETSTESDSEPDAKDNEDAEDDCAFVNLGFDNKFAPSSVLDEMERAGYCAPAFNTSRAFNKELLNIHRGNVEDVKQDLEKYHRP